MTLNDSKWLKQFQTDSKWLKMMQFDSKSKGQKKHKPMPHNDFTWTLYQKWSMSLDIWCFHSQIYSRRLNNNIWYGPHNCSFYQLFALDAYVMHKFFFNWIHLTHFSHFESFWVILSHFESFWLTLAILSHFESFWVILGHSDSLLSFWVILSHFG
jgi:hypothetical protein